MKNKIHPINNEALYNQWKLAIETDCKFGEFNKESIKEREKLFILLMQVINFVLSSSIFSRGLDKNECKSEASYKFFKYWKKYDLRKTNAFAYAVQVIKNSNFTISTKISNELRMRNKYFNEN